MTVTKLKKSKISETTEGTVYEFELEKGKSDMEVAISPEGKVIKKEAKEEGDEDND